MLIMRMNFNFFKTTMKNNQEIKLSQMGGLARTSEGSLAVQESPCIEVMEVQVEQGFAQSLDDMPEEEWD